MAKTRFLLALAYLCVTALGAGYAPKNTHQYCFDAIYTSFNALSWPTTSEAHTNSSETAVQAHGQSKRAQGATPKKSPAYCSSLVEVTSLYASSKILCQGEEFSEGIIFWKGLCKSVGSPLMDLTGIKTTATHEYIEKLMVVDPSTTNITKMTSPVVLDKHYYEKAVRYLVSMIIILIRLRTLADETRGQTKRLDTYQPIMLGALWASGELSSSSACSQSFCTPFAKDDP